MSHTKSACDNEERLLLIFKNAIQSEREAQNEYKDALEYCDDPVIRDVLTNLYEEEVRHEAILVEYYARLRKKYDTMGRPLKH